MKTLKLLKCDSDKETFHILQDKADMVERWSLAVSNHRKCKNTVLFFFFWEQKSYGECKVLSCFILQYAKDVWVLVLAIRLNHAS